MKSMEPRTGVRLYAFLIAAMLLSWLFVSEYFVSVSTESTFQTTVNELAIGSLILVGLLVFVGWKGSKYSRADTTLDDWTRRKHAAVVMIAVILPAMTGLWYGIFTLNTQVTSAFTVITAVVVISAFVYAIYVLGGLGGSIERL
jgi:hypothetical protein